MPNYTDYFNCLFLKYFDTIMKKIKLYIYIFFLVSFFACSKEEKEMTNNSSNNNNTEEQNNPNGENPSIVGVWNLTSLNFFLDETETYPNGNQAFLHAYGFGRNLDILLTYSENPNKSTDQGNCELEWYIENPNGDDYPFYEKEFRFGNFVGDWTIENNTLTIVNDVITITGTIFSLTETHISYDMNWTEDYKEGDAQVHNDIRLELEFERQ